MTILARLSLACVALLGWLTLGDAARASCSDDIQNGDESGVDCGGSCLKCDGATCGGNGECRSGSCVDDICSVVFSIDTSQGQSAAHPGTPVAIDPTLTIAGSGTITGARVLIQSGFVASEDTLAFAAQGGISGSYAPSTGVLTLGGTATVAAYEAALRTVTYNDTNVGSPNTSDRVITFSLGQNGLALESTGHFYEFISGFRAWPTARDEAAARRYFGLKGYLTTVTNGVENSFIAGKLQGEGWMGANDAVDEGTWRWVTGPEGFEDGGKGRHFYTGQADTGYPEVGLRVDRLGSGCGAPSECQSGVCATGTCLQYDRWNRNPTTGLRQEPNNCCASGEDYGHFFVSADWNDYDIAYPAITGYVVEYGGMPGDPPLVLQDNKTVRIVSISCSDTTQNGSETDIDCGGTCGPCATGKHCGGNGDCSSFVCTDGVCQAPSCFDSVRNGSETDRDCGGSCVADCGNGLGCNSGGDCLSGKCTSNVCQVPTCSDSVKNNGETDVDCGGPSCAECANGNACIDNGDCQSSICASNVCQTAACTDHVQNGTETDIDCGGSCSACTPTMHCAGANDCTSRVCTVTVCQAPLCGDGVRNGSETGVDCGGSCAADCAPGGGCASGADCTTGVCSNTICQAATCNDGVKNQDETGPDCGGPTCTGDCGPGGGCGSGSDCTSGVCSGQICQAPACNDGVLNGGETDLDCGGACGPCEPSEHCVSGSDCTSGICEGTTCQAPSCFDSVSNGGESGLDCGGACPACAVGQHCTTHDDCASRACLVGTCVAASCTDDHTDGSETDVDCGGADCPDCAYGDDCLGNGDCATARCVSGSCGCDEDELIANDGVTCIARGECDPEGLSCSLATELVFYGVVSNAGGAYGSIRCVRAVDGQVSCDTNPDGTLAVSPTLWCTP